MDNSILAAIQEQLQQSSRILVACHIRPDGDAIGSLLGLGLAIQQAGKQVQMVSVDGVPSSCRHLAAVEQIKTQASGQFDTTIFVDCSDSHRSGEILGLLKQPDINIDHHITNGRYAQINLVDPSAVATAQILSEVIPQLGLAITQPVAAALLTGIVSDSLGFRTSNMTPQALRVAADLMDKGVDISETFRLALVQRSFEAARYWGLGLNRLEKDGRMAWTWLTLEDRKISGYSGRDDADLINILSAIADTDITLVFVEQSRKHVKVSWRAQPGVDVSQLAVRFGGGGHPAAAGAEIQGTLQQVLDQVLPATRSLLVGTPDPIG
jgi:bifunctional oligoribonuclease and PAP phosphatase NrnA